MSFDNAKAFLKKIESDKSLQDNLKAAGSNIEAAVKVGAQHGLTFNADELKAAQDELWGHLSDDDLKNVAGGLKSF